MKPSWSESVGPRARDGAVEPLAYSYETAAKALAVSPRTVWEWVSQGRLWSVRVGGVVRISRDAILEFLEENEQALEGGAP